MAQTTDETAGSDCQQQQATAHLPEAKDEQSSCSTDEHSVVNQIGKFSSKKSLL